MMETLSTDSPKKNPSSDGTADAKRWEYYKLLLEQEQLSMCLRNRTFILRAKDIDFQVKATIRKQMIILPDALIINKLKELATKIQKLEQELLSLGL